MKFEDIDDVWIDKWKDCVTETIAIAHGIEPEDTKSLAILGWNLCNPDDMIEDKTKVLTLYHGTADPNFKPNPEYRNENTDYGPGLYLTPYLELAKEWSVGVSSSEVGYVFKFKIDTTKCSVFNFDEVNPLVWLAELASNYLPFLQLDQEETIVAEKLIEMYHVYRTNIRDVLAGWRADSSFRNTLIFALNGTLPYRNIVEALKAGNLREQYCIKSKYAYDILEFDKNPICTVGKEYYGKYVNTVRNAEQYINNLCTTNGETLLDYLED